ncbi:hypothetical protein RRG08_019323 [Elysia crispata]|uniref:Uncharacterized protein n=1 Tax=Elysia crispata TaxID=231223 RepID=A0AAE1ANH7_9GAST|nr:hypothetical protein RRG08_019323 [Elysia crispata]
MAGYRKHNPYKLGDGSLQNTQPIQTRRWLATEYTTDTNYAMARYRIHNRYKLRDGWLQNTQPIQTRGWLTTEYITDTNYAMADYRIQQIQTRRWLVTEYITDTNYIVWLACYLGFTLYMYLLHCTYNPIVIFEVT